jgi:hypothetical protein
VCLGCPVSASGLPLLSVPSIMLDSWPRGTYGMDTVILWPLPGFVDDAGGQRLDEPGGACFSWDGTTTRAGVSGLTALRPSALH